MGLFSRIFSKTEPQTWPEDLEGLVAALAEQRNRIQSAERIAKLRPDLLKSAVAARGGVNVIDDSGPSLVIAKLSPSDARKLAKSGIVAFRNETSSVANTIKSQLDQRAQADMSALVERLLLIMAGTEANRVALREAAGYFLIEELGARAGTAIETSLDHGDAKIRFQAAHVLRFVRSDHAVDRLIAALSDPDGDVRAMVTRALALQKDKRAIPALLEAAENDASSGVRQQAKAAADVLQGS